MAESLTPIVDAPGPDSSPLQSAGNGRGAADAGALGSDLTRREREILGLLAQRLTDTEIAAHLFISPKTVDTYKQRIGEKLGLSHRAAYISFALKLGLLAEKES